MYCRYYDICEIYFQLMMYKNINKNYSALACDYYKTMMVLSAECALYRHLQKQN